MRVRKLRSCVFWQGTLKQEGVKQMGRKVKGTCKYAILYNFNCLKIFLYQALSTP
jgi:hypothetical protein